MTSAVRSSVSRSEFRFGAISSASSAAFNLPGYSLNFPKFLLTVGSLSVEVCRIFAQASYSLAAYPIVRADENKLSPRFYVNFSERKFSEQN